MEWQNKQTYRSEPRVNMNDDMVRVMLTMSRLEWIRLRREYDIRCYFCGAGDDNHHSFSCPTGLHEDRRK